MSARPATDIAAHLIDVGAVSGVAADDTYVNGAAVDMTSYAGAAFAFAYCAFHFSAASTSGSPTNTLALDVQTDDNSSFTSAAVLKAATSITNVHGDGVSYGRLWLPVNLLDVDTEQYIRVRAKLTEAGTTTITLQQLNLGILLGGFKGVPHANYSADGWSTVSLAS